MSRIRYACALALAAATVAAAASAAPPEVPPVVRVKPGQMVRVVVKADEGKLGHGRDFHDEEAFWGELVGPKGTRAFVFQAPPDSDRKSYTVVWWTVGEATGVPTVILVEGAVVAPPPKKKPDDPAAPVGSYYFLAVRADGPAAPEFTRAVGLPAWADLRKKGHQFRDATVTEARTEVGLVLPAGTPIPCVVTMKVTGNVSTVVGYAALPSTDAGVLKLAEGLK